MSGDERLGMALLWAVILAVAAALLLGGVGWLALRGIMAVAS